ncbi:histidine kinase [Flavobacterium sp. DG1-102-2]|uniref:sensor histidine kinase n=1 Tax=Flavobacterium sp. DG1-102-2 TaxID=3081663 RepID=UPI00294A71C9|nr:ATP-binding protein [Flavobacterium sp. DG1-102-2]MDV6166879.1 histidine kinase [Flavobacterium sp. DG1-102-2]
MEKWQDPQVIAFWIAIIIVFIVTLLFFVVKILHAGYKRMTEANLRETQLLLDHQKKLLETNLYAQEKERMRVAGDLHDSLIGKLVVVKMKSQIGVTLTELDTMLEESITEARRISHDLTPPLLGYSRIDELIEDILAPWRDKFEMNYKKDVTNSQDLPSEAKIQVIRVVQELIVNINKHAQAKAVSVHLRYSDRYFTLAVKDNGKGFDTSLLKKGLGLSNMELRMQYLNASHKVKSVPGKGTTTIIATIINPPL